MTTLNRNKDLRPKPCSRKEPDDLAGQLMQCRVEIDAALDTIKQPGRLLTDREQKIISALIKKIGKLADALHTLPKPCAITAGMRLHELTLVEIKTNGGKLDYCKAFARVAVNNWLLVQEWQQLVQVPRRTR